MQDVDQAKRHAKAASTNREGFSRPVIALEIYFDPQVLNKFCTLHPQVFHTSPPTRRSSAVPQEYNGRPHTQHLVVMKLGLVILLWLALLGTASAAEPTLFRLYLTDGTTVVSYGEFARVGDRVIFSLPIGSGLEPRLHAATLPAAVIDW